MFKAWRVDHDVAVPTDLPGPGVYSELVSLVLSAQLEQLGPDVRPERLALRDADSPDRLRVMSHAWRRPPSQRCRRANGPRWVSNS